MITPAANATHSSVTRPSSSAQKRNALSNIRIPPKSSLSGRVAGRQIQT
jgi:hypothetical protein